MYLEDELHTREICIQQLHNAPVNLHVLRLDKLHPVISGNKWFKLKYYLQEAIINNYTTIATFGGAYSNHILATAYACNKEKIQCIGYIRGEEPKQYSQTLIDAQALNMQLKFLSRGEFSSKKNNRDADSFTYIIPQGGYGITGAKGASEILQFVPDLSLYNYIVCAVGTGTMLAGIANASMLHQQCIGVSVMKNNFSLENEINFLVNDDAKDRVHLLHKYHFGGYAKHTQALIDFIKSSWEKYQLPLDFVYTAKALFAVFDLAEKKYFTTGENILFIHSGGLQGNRSLVETTFQSVK